MPFFKKSEKSEIIDFMALCSLWHT